MTPKPLSDAVHKGFAYLIRQQSRDGGWSQGGGWRTDNQGGRVEGPNVADPPDVANTWNLSGANAGKLKTTDFVAIENLTGGKADDTFQVVGASASLSGVLDGGLLDIAAPTVNTLDYSLRGSAVIVDLQLATGPGLTGGFSRITRVVGTFLFKASSCALMRFTSA